MTASAAPRPTRSSSAGSSRTACRRQERARCSNACAARPAPRRDAAAGRTRRRRHEAGPPGCAIHRNAGGARRGRGSVSDRRHRARAARRRRACGARRAADRLGHLHERERRRAGARPDWAGSRGPQSRPSVGPPHEPSKLRGVRVTPFPRPARIPRACWRSLRSPQPSGQRIVIFKGVGGRDALRAELVRRGATVVVAEVYRRVPSCRPPVRLEAGQRLRHRVSRGRSRECRGTSSRCCSSHPSHGYRTSRTRPCSCPANALPRRHASTAGAGRSSWPEAPRTTSCSIR